MAKLRRPGSPWRLLAHRWVGGPSPTYSDSVHIDNADATTATRLHEGYAVIQEHHPDTEFDELVVGRWLHVEAMGAGEWWMSVGGVTLWVDVDRDGRPRKVTVYGPDDYAEPVPGCEYQCAWTEGA